MICDYESEITLPVPVPFPDDEIPVGQELKFAYALGDEPGLVIRES